MLATFRGVRVDAADPRRLGSWWADVLGLAWRADDHDGGAAIGATPSHTVRFQREVSPKVVKNRVHLDIYARSLAELEAVSSTVVEVQREGWGWTVMADPEGGEYCAFVREELPADRLHGLVVDCVEPKRIATWWSEVYGANLVIDRGFATVEDVPGMPILTMDFVPVPEPKFGTNRISWDVTAEPAALLAAGATLVAGPTAERSGHVLADPEGNEFNVFPP